MRILALECGGKPGGFVLAEDERVLAREIFSGPWRQNEELLPRLDAQQRRLGWPPGGADLVAVNLGPGSYTGVRIACVVARTLAQVSGACVVGASAFEVLAEQLGTAGDRLAIALDARMSEVFTACYESRGDQAPPVPLRHPGAESPLAWRRFIESEAQDHHMVLAGDGYAAYPALTDPFPGEGERIARPADRVMPDAALLHRLAWRRARAGEFSASAALTPLYLRRPIAKTTNEVKAMRRAADNDAAPPKPAD